MLVRRHALRRCLWTRIEGAQPRASASDDGADHGAGRATHGDALAFWRANLEGMRRAPAADLLAANELTMHRIAAAREALLAHALELRQVCRVGAATALASTTAALG